MVIGSSLLNRLNSKTWYVRPEVLQSFATIFNAKFNLDEKFIDKTLSLFGENDTSENELLSYQRSDSGLLQAIINIEGTLVRKAGYLDSMCGITGMNLILNALDEAKNKADGTIILWDCPGGTVDGTQEVSNAVYDLRKSQRVISLVVGEMCSGGYYIGSAADEIYATEDSNLIGSIGVYMLHTDMSKADEKEGYKFTYIQAGKEKTYGNPHQELSLEAKDKFQKLVDGDYETFLKTVERNRNITREEVLKYADGQVFRAADLVGTPMIDGITTLKEILTRS
jgi:capsid assembly protease